MVTRGGLLLLAACTYSVGEVRPATGGATPIADGGLVPETGAPPVLLADAQDDAFLVAVDDQSVYWADRRGIWYCTTKDCHDVQSLSMEEQTVVGMAPFGERVYWALGAGVNRWIRSTGVIERIDNSASSDVVAFAANDAAFYFTVGPDTGGVASCPIGGCAKFSDYVSGYGWKGASGLALSKDGFVFTSGGKLVYCAPTCGGPDDTNVNVLADNQTNVRAITADDRFAYWSTGSAVMRASLKQPFTPGPFAAIADVRAITVDATNVHVIAGKSVIRIAKDGGAQTVLAGDLPDPRALAVDATRVYVANGGARGTIVAIAK